MPDSTTPNQALADPAGGVTPAPIAPGTYVDARNPADTGWQAFPGAAGWAAQPGVAGPAWRLDQLGQMHLRGTVRALNAFADGAIVGTLPYAPTAAPGGMNWPVRRTINLAQTTARVDVDEFGEVIAANAGSAGDWINLDPITYLID